MRRTLVSLSLCFLVAAATACSDDDSSPTDSGGGATSAGGADGGGTDGGGAGGTGSADDCDAPAPRYAFESRFVEGESSVSYSGQTWRHIAMLDMKGRLGQLTSQIESGTVAPESVKAILEETSFRFNADNGNGAFNFETRLPAEQSTYDDISTDKDLVGKIAGNDAVTDYVDWSSEFMGWEGAATPEALVDQWLDLVAANAEAQASAERTRGAVTLPVYVTDDGLDLQQLLQKFLLGAVAFAQGADDYLDDDTEGKGLLASNGQADDATYSPLEHAWDEGFGYFGAARDHDTYTDEEVAGKGGRDQYADGQFDTDCDGRIDLTSEIVLGHAQNASKRDLGATEPTDFSKDAFDAFVAGRALIASAGETLTDAELEELKGYRDAALEAWEQAIAATAIHYINDTIADLDKLGTDEYDFLAHAKHWGELKGFALSFQFNPRSPFNVKDAASKADFQKLHQLLADAPTLEESAVADRKAALLEARDLLATAYGFSAANAAGW